MAKFNPDEYLKKKEEFNPDWYLAQEAPREKETTLKDFAKGATEALPMVGGMVGGAIAAPGLVTSAAGGGLGYAAGKALENYIEQNYFNEPKTTEELIAEPLKSIPEGVAQEFGGALLMKGAQKLAPYALKAEQAMIGQAGKLAENATGATAVQAAKFRPGTGERLLQDKLVKPFDTAENIATRIGNKIGEQEQSIESALKFVDESGITVSADKIANKLEQRAAELSQDPAKADVAKKIQNIVTDIYNSGKSLVTASEAEQTKRGFNKVAKNWLDPQQGEAGKIAYRAYRDAVEEAAVAAGKGEQFKAAKETYGYLSPVLDASERRALQQQQSPFGGLLDISAIGAGGALGGGPGAVAGAAAKNFIAPRTASTLATGFDAMSAVPKVIGKTLNSRGIQPVTSAISNIGTQAVYPQLFPKQETTTEKAQRINLERKLIKGK